MFKKIPYQELNPRQQENYNFHKISALLADYGFTTLRLSDDWQGADFIAQHIDGELFLKVQLKGRLTFCKKYFGKNLYIAFSLDDQWYLYPHDDLFNQVEGISNLKKTKSWQENGEYHFPTLPVKYRELLNKFAL